MANYHQRFLTLEERFWEKVNKRGPDECWNWTAYKNKKGYGQFSLHGAPRNAARVSWILSRRPQPKGMYVLHHCDNPSCVNPKHLFLGTNADNVADRHAKGRSARTMGRFGWSNSMAKLTQEKVDRIRLLYTLPKVTQAKLADVFNVSFQQISRIVRNERWTV